MKNRLVQVLTIALFLSLIASFVAYKAGIFQKEQTSLLNHFEGDTTALPNSHNLVEAPSGDLYVSEEEFQLMKSSKYTPISLPKPVFLFDRTTLPGLKSPAGQAEIPPLPDRKKNTNKYYQETAPEGYYFDSTAWEADKLMMSTSKFTIILDPADYIKKK